LYLENKEMNGEGCLFFFSSNLLKEEAEREIPKKSVPMHSPGACGGCR
jgi:hypothetical protein